jgi:hypothetical protein
MSDFECEDFSLDSLDSIFDETPVTSHKQMDSSSISHNFSSDSANSSSFNSSSPFFASTKDDIKEDFNFIPFPNTFNAKEGIHDNSNIGPPFIHYPERNCSSDSITGHPNNFNIANHNQPFGINHCGPNNSMNDNMFELQPSYETFSFQSPVADIPGFEWCSTLDWNENVSYDSPIVPSLPYSAYHTHYPNTPTDCSSSPAPMVPLGPMPPLELINPSHCQEEKFSCSSYSQDMSQLSASHHDLNGDLNVLGVHLNNLMQGTNNSSDVNARLLTDLTKTSVPPNDNHFTPPPSPNTDAKHFQLLSPSNVVSEHK